MGKVTQSTLVETKDRQAQADEELNMFLKGQENRTGERRRRRENGGRRLLDRDARNQKHRQANQEPIRQRANLCTNKTAHKQVEDSQSQGHTSKNRGRRTVSEEEAHKWIGRALQLKKIAKKQSADEVRNDPEGVALLQALFSNDEEKQHGKTCSSNVTKMR